MLRIWGGGYFEKDILYNLCDKYGILIWHDMLFACGTYPGDGFFSDNYFDLIPGETKAITFEAKSIIMDLKNILNVVSLVDSY